MKRGTSIHFNSTSSSDLTTSTFSNVAHISILSSPLDRDSSEALGRSSIFFKVQKLFDQLKIKITPVPLDPFSKKPSRAGWNAPDYDPNTYSWARHYGNVGIVLGRSNLLVFDCDTPETANFFENLAQEVDLTTDTLVVKTRRGTHYYYYCPFSHELERKKFAREPIKLDIIAGNNYLVVAPYSQLKLNEKGEILDPRAKNFTLFEYTPVNIPERLPEISKKQFKTLIKKLEKIFNENEELEEKIQGETLNLNERDLTDEEIQKLCELVEPYFVEGQRQNLILYLAGYLRKNLKITEESVIKFYEYFIHTDDKQDIKARLAAIKKTYQKNPSVIAGVKGLTELLGEDVAKELCKKIRQALNIPENPEKPEKIKQPHELIEKIQSQITPERTQYIFVEISRKKMKYARCNYSELVIDYGVVKYDIMLKDYVFDLHTKIFDCVPNKVYIIENPLTSEKKLEIHFASKLPDSKYISITGTIQEIWETLYRQTSFVLSTGMGLQVLTNVVNYYLKRGWYEKKLEKLPPGFYFFNNTLHAEFTEKNYTKEELAKAANLLKDYILSHPNAQLIASIVLAGLLLPFSFAQKQMCIQGKLSQKMKYLYLFGETKSGKTTTATLLASIWGHVNKISYASFNTESRAGKHLSNSTFILIVDEVSKDIETNTVKEILKYAQEDLIARTIQTKNLKQVHYPALAPIIMTSNSHFPEDPALLERFYVFRFGKADKISREERLLHNYDKEKFRVLEPLGQFIWKYVKKHGLKDDYIAYAREILEAFYQEAEVEAFWYNLDFIHHSEETEEEQQYKQESEFYNAVIKFFNQNVKKQKEEENFVKTIYDALRARQFGRWIWIDDKDFVHISKDFLWELKKSYRCNIRDLEELSELTGWIKKRQRYSNTVIWVVSTAVTDFFHKLNYLPKMLTSLVFHAWLENKLDLSQLLSDTETDTFPVN